MLKAITPILAWAFAVVSGGLQLSPGLDLGYPGMFLTIPVNPSTFNPTSIPEYAFYQIPGGMEIYNPNGFPHAEEVAIASGHFLADDALGRHPWKSGYVHTATPDFPIELVGRHFDFPARKMGWTALAIDADTFDAEFLDRERYSVAQWDLFRADDYPYPPPSRILEITFEFKYIDPDHQVQVASPCYWMMVN